jgi:mono/diheme cytochrome c family protein
VFANGKRGDGIWMFSLDGKIESLKGSGLLSAAGSVGETANARSTQPAASGGGSSRGQQIYQQACVPCHGESGTGGHGGGPSLVAGQDVDKIVAVTSAGRNNMPSFSGMFSADDIHAVATYIVDDLAKKKP